MTLAEIRALKARYEGTAPLFIAGIELSNGTTVMAGFIADLGDGYVIRREGGRMDYVPKTGISCIRIDNITDYFAKQGIERAPGPKKEEGE